MKNKKLFLIPISLTLLITACSKAETADTADSVSSDQLVSEQQVFDSGSSDESSFEDSSVSDESYIEYNDDDRKLSVPSFDTAEELHEYIMERREAQARELFESGSDGDKLISYSFNNIPEGYELSQARQSGIFLTYDYVNANDNSKITFVWGFGTDGDEYLKSAVEMFELAPLPGYEGYYYSDAADDSGTLIHQIYWSEDGYCFQLNIPVGYLPISGSEDGVNAAEVSGSGSFDFGITKNLYDVE